MANRPPRLDPFQKYDPPLYVVTLNTHRRKRFLANDRIHGSFVKFARVALGRGVAVGQYVIMPDHIHLFVAGHYDFALDQWVRAMKRTLSTAIFVPRPHWQNGFFDHLIRHEESHCQKWEYVVQNPVRAGLVSNPEDWPWQGEIEAL